MDATEMTPAPNHHAGHKGCGGPAGLIAGLTMTVGRSGDARLARELTRTDGQDHVVDIGCGPGAAARAAARAGARVTGVEPSAVMLGLARRLTRSSASVTYVDGSAEALPLPDGDASVVWTIASVHHWHDLDAALSEVRRVVAPAGRFLAIERRVRPGATGHASHGWTTEQAEEFARLCRDHGFDDVGVDRHAVGRRRLVSVLATSP
jgi:ubiquinone/menaquinone biosynthesis C-methylase UbiE